MAVQLRRGVPHPRLHIHLQGSYPQLPLPLVWGHGGAGGGEAEEEGVEVGHEGSDGDTGAHSKWNILASFMTR